MKIIKGLFAIVFLLNISPIFSQNNFSIYYISIGSTHYSKSVEDLDNCPNWMESLPSANYSARIFVNEINRIQPKKGLLITSQKKNVVSKSRIISEFQKFGLLIKRDSAKEKFVLIYFYGHGASNNVNQVLYLIPGNIACEGSYFYVNEMDDKAISIMSLVTMIRTHLGNVTPIILLDCCYNFRPANPEYKRMTDSVDSSFWRSPHWIGPWSRMRRWDVDLTNWPILFGSPKGGSSEPILHEDGSNNEKIGPVCNSFIKALRKISLTTNPSLGRLIFEMKANGINSNAFGGFNYGPNIKISPFPR
ncbi:MAG: hypothetical protein WCF67_15615 [Chitinophagaceae bacterium]